MEILMEVTPNKWLKPMFEVDEEKAQKWVVGQVAEVKVTFKRNPQFHRKFFALLNTAFDAWNPEELEFKGKKVGKNFDRFRDDLTCLAGYYDVVIALNGEPKAVPKSISFASMEEAEFEDLYSKVIDVVLKHILTNYTREDIDDVVDAVLGYA